MSEWVWRSRPVEGRHVVITEDGNVQAGTVFSRRYAHIASDERRAAAAALLGCDEAHIRVVADDEIVVKRGAVEVALGALPVGFSDDENNMAAHHFRAALGDGSATT